MVRGPNSIIPILRVDRVYRRRGAANFEVLLLSGLVALGAIVATTQLSRDVRTAQIALACQLQEWLGAGCGGEGRLGPTTPATSYPEHPGAPWVFPAGDQDHAVMQIGQTSAPTGIDRNQFAPLLTPEGLDYLEQVGAPTSEEAAFELGVAFALSRSSFNKEAESGFFEAMLPQMGSPDLLENLHAGFTDVDALVIRWGLEDAAKRGGSIPPFRELLESTLAHIDGEAELLRQRFIDPTTSFDTRHAIVAAFAPWLVTEPAGNRSLEALLASLSQEQRADLFEVLAVLPRYRPRFDNDLGPPDRAPHLMPLPHAETSDAVGLMSDAFFAFDWHDSSATDALHRILALATEKAFQDSLTYSLIGSVWLAEGDLEKLEAIERFAEALPVSDSPLGILVSERELAGVMSRIFRDEPGVDPALMAAWVGEPAPASDEALLGVLLRSDIPFDVLVLASASFPDERDDGKSIAQRWGRALEAIRWAEPGSEAAHNLFHALERLDALGTDFWDNATVFDSLTAEALEQAPESFAFSSPDPELQAVLERDFEEVALVNGFLLGDDSSTDSLATQVRRLDPGAYEVALKGARLSQDWPVQDRRALALVVEAEGAAASRLVAAVEDTGSLEGAVGFLWNTLDARKKQSRVAAALSRIEGAPLPPLAKYAIFRQLEAPIGEKDSAAATADSLATLSSRAWFQSADASKQFRYVQLIGGLSNAIRDAEDTPITGGGRILASQRELMEQTLSTLLNLDLGLEDLPHNVAGWASARDGYITIDDQKIPASTLVQAWNVPIETAAHEASHIVNRDRNTASADYFFEEMRAYYMGLVTANGEVPSNVDLIRRSHGLLTSKTSYQSIQRALFAGGEDAARIVAFYNAFTTQQFSPDRPEELVRYLDATIFPQTLKDPDAPVVLPASEMVGHVFELAVP